MDYIDIVTDLISRVGFPIVVAGALFWYVFKKDKMHAEETGALRESLKMNTQVLTEVKELISRFLTRGV